MSFTGALPFDALSGILASSLMRVSTGALVLVLSLTVTGGATAQMTSRRNTVDNNPGHLKMALVNMKALFSDSSNAEANKRNIQINLDRHLYFVDMAVAQGAEFIGFPETSINGYHVSGNITWLSMKGPQVAVLKKKAKESKVYISAGMFEQDFAGKKWNTQFVIGDEGKIVCVYHKIWLTKLKAYAGTGSEHKVFDVKGAKMGIGICADMSDYYNGKALADRGAEIIYAPHANNTGGTTAGWYRFRSKWTGTWDGQNTTNPRSNNGPKAQMPSGGWAQQLKIYAAFHNNAGRYNPDFAPPVTNNPIYRYASGAWFIGPDGKVLAQQPSSNDRKDSKEYVLIYNVPIRNKRRLKTVKAKPAPVRPLHAKPRPQPKPVTEDMRRKSRLAIARSYEMNKRYDMARRGYEEFIRQYPDAPETETARRRLAAIMYR